MNYLEHSIKTPVGETTNEHLLHTRYCSRPEDAAVNKTKIPALKELMFQWGEKNNQSSHKFIKIISNTTKQSLR